MTAAEMAAKRDTRVLTGVGVGVLCASGTLHFWKKKRREAQPYRGAREEKRAFSDALLRARERTAVLARRTEDAAGEDAAAIFEIHDMLLADADFSEGVRRKIDSGKTAAEAVEAVAEEMAAVFEAMADEYFAARAADMRDVGSRVVDELLGGGGELPDGRVIIVADELTPSDTVAFDSDKVLGFVTFGGSVNSHTAILARALAIPALVRVGEISDEYDGAEALLDAENGTLTLFPTPDMLLKFATAESARRAEEQRLRALISLPAITRSGKKIGLFANIGGISGAEEAYRAGADGIGLFRSEFLFLGRDTLPSEEEQYQAYSRVARIMKDRGGPVVVRTLDAGSDKVVAVLAGEKEENPALGVRGIRLLLSHPDVLRTQLRALCRASAHGKIAIMLPMVVSVKEIVGAKEIFEGVRRELAAEGVPMAERIPFGVMIETPAAAIMARELAAEADFFSVGTNDLCQYTLAADRQNSALAHLSQSEADLECVFRLIKNAADAIHAHGGGKWIGICGELAADTALTARFLECGADELSVSPPFLLKLKEKIRLID